MNLSNSLLKTYKFKLLPSFEEKRELIGFANARRWVYNACVLFAEEANLAAKAAGASWPEPKTFHEYNLSRILNQWCDENPWLKHAPKQSLQQAIRDFVHARESFLGGTAERPPKFASVKKMTPTFRCPQHVALNQESIRLPKIGWVKMRNSYGRGVPDGELRNATIKFEKVNWWAIVLIKQCAEVPISVPSERIGVDTGIKNTITTSSRQELHAPIMTEEEANQVYFLEKCVARCEYGSNRRAKAQARLNKFKLSITRRVQDWRHKTTTELSKNNGLIAVENLNIKNMTKSAKGTVETPGTNIAQKSGLNRALLEPGFGIIFDQLAYKQAWRGHEFIKVPPAYTSQHCPRCQKIDSNNRPTRDDFCCVSCQYSDNADIVAAQNILALGKTIIGGRTDRICAHSDENHPETMESRTREPNLTLKGKGVPTRNGGRMSKGV